MEGNGAVDYLNPDGSEGELVGATIAQCIAACDVTLGCVGFKYKPFDGNKCRRPARPRPLHPATFATTSACALGRCFLRSSISLGDCAAAADQDTWTYVGWGGGDCASHAAPRTGTQQISARLASTEACSIQHPEFNMRRATRDG